MKIPEQWGSIKNMLIGKDEEYVSNDIDRVEVRKTVFKEKGKTVRSSYGFTFRIQTPKSVGFQNVELDPLPTPDPDCNPCSFPVTCDLLGPYCMACFLNQLFHPQPEYSHIVIGFLFDGPEIEEMEVIDDEYDPTDLSSKPGGYSFAVWYSSECSPYLPYHNISARPELDYDYEINRYIIDGLWIQRIADNTWRILVKEKDFTVKEIYCEEYTMRGPNTKWQFRVPLKAEGNFTYMMDWIKNVR